MARMATDQERLILLLEANHRNFERALSQAERTADRRFAAIERRAQNSVQKVNQDFRNFADQARTALAALGVGLIARDVIELGDAWTRTGNMIAAAGVNVDQVATVQGLVADIASRTRSNLEATADLFGRMYRSSEDLGASMSDVLAVTELVSKALSGADQSERAGAIRQLGQGLGSGALQGDELRSILENSRAISEAIAAEFDTTVGNLRKLGAAGQLESRRVFQAILNAGSDIEARFANTTFTVADAFQHLRTEAARFIGTNEQTKESTRALTRLIDFAANNFEMLASAAIVAASYIGGAFAGVALGRAVAALRLMITEMTLSGLKAKSLQTALAFFGGPLGIALTAAGVGMAYLATQTDAFASRAETIQRAEDSLYSALQVIAGLETVTEEAAESADNLAEAHGDVATLTDEANSALDRMTTSSEGAAEQLSIQERAARGLAEAERERAIATLSAAAANQADMRIQLLRDQAVNRARPRGSTFAGMGIPRQRPEVEAERIARDLEALAESERIINDGLAALQERRAAPGGNGNGNGNGNGGAGAADRGRQLADLRAAAELSLARLRHEEARVRELEDIEQIDKRTTAYVQTGIAATVARAQAESEVRAEREAMNAEAERTYQMQVLQDQIDLARISNNIALADVLQDQYEIQRRTRELVDLKATSEEEATRLATEYVQARREATNIERQHNLDNRQLETELEAARLRGGAAAERALRRRLDLEERIKALRQEGLKEDAATARAEAEIAALEQADFQGQFRRWFTGGITAALEGDLDEFFENWIRERAAAGLENALNEVADILFDSFRGVLTNVIRSGQDGLGQAVAAVFAGGATGGLNQLGEDAAKAGEALSGVLAASAADAAAQVAMTGVAAAANAAKETAAAATKTSADFQVVASSIVLAKSLLAAATAAQTFAASGGGGGKGGFIASIASQFLKFGGGKASGGPVAPGNWYMVGEHGPEPFVPAVPGFIIPNGAFGGGVTVQYVDRRTLNFQGTSEELSQFKQFVMEMESSRDAQIMAVAEVGLRRRKWGRR